MRVIAGSAKGRPLAAPRGRAVRPTSDKVKGAIFSMLESLLLSLRADEEPELLPAEVWRGLTILDLYAGTGALAIEALSRGAEWADLVDASQESCRVIKRNLATTGFAAKAHVYCMSAQRALDAQSGVIRQGGYDIIALDPPYADQAIAEVVRLVSESGAARTGTVVVVEHSKRVALEDQIALLKRVREKTHGDTTVSVYVQEENAS